jgi:UDP-N-acetylglucosamine transferase subunit ALG13
VIFVSTGTHEQSFDRLVQCVDRLASGADETFFIQYGYHTKLPVHAAGECLIDREKMENLIREARIVITHGGPGSISACFDANKIPIVVPRQHPFGEHVDDHQLLFCRRLAISKRIILVEDIAGLEKAIQHYEQWVLACGLPEGNSRRGARTNFCQKLAVVLENS